MISKWQSLLSQTYQTDEALPDETPKKLNIKILHS